MAININEFEKAAENGGIIRPQAESPDKLRSSSNSLWKRLRGPSSAEKADNQSIRGAFAHALEEKYGKAFVDSISDQLNVKSNRPLSAKTVQALIEAGNKHLQNSPAPPTPKVAPSESKEVAKRSVTGATAKSLTDHLDAQNAQLQRLQERDRAIFDSLPEGAAKVKMRETINDRSADIAQNNRFKDRIEQGEDLTRVQSEMVDKRVLLVTMDEREQLKKEVAKLDEAAKIPPKRSVTGATAKSLTDHLDTQNAQLQQLQKRDMAKLADLSDGPEKVALQGMIDERNADIAQNDWFKGRINQGEDLTTVQREMVDERVLLVPMDDRQKLNPKAYEDLNKVASNQPKVDDLSAQEEGYTEDQQQQLNAILNQSFAPLTKPPPTVLPPLPGEQPALSKPPPKVLPPLPGEQSALSKPPPTTLPPLPSEGPPALERSTSVRDLLKNKGAVANNPFKVQDDALKVAKPENDDKDKHKESTGHAISPQKPSAPKPSSHKPGSL